MTATKKQDSMARLVIVLFVISAVTALLLGLVNFITEDKIAAINAEKTAAAMAEVMPGDFRFEDVGNGVFTASGGGEVKGYVVQVAASGFGGMLDMVVGVSTEGTVTGVAIISHSETSGLGANATREDYRAQYIGATGSLAVTKDGGTIDALTGATVTSRAVTNGVNAALEAVHGLG